MYRRILSGAYLIGLFSILLTLTGCSGNGYIEVRNQSASIIENVRWGTVVELGSIEVGQESGLETEHHESLQIFFSKNGKNYVSKKSFNVDARTSATYIHKDSSDADIVN
jgi:hypothetical protein